MSSPLRMSALSSGRRAEGMDFCRRCCLCVSARCRRRDSPDLVLDSRSAEVARDLGSGSETWADLFCLRQTLPIPLMTKSETKRHSMPRLTNQDSNRIYKALQNRRGRIVNEYSHASRHARIPNQSTCSRAGGSRRKLDKRSSLTRDDSYGKSFVTERCIYKGEGRPDASSNCRYVGTDSGGSGMDGGMGEGKAGSAISGEGLSCLDSCSKRPFP